MQKLILLILLPLLLASCKSAPSPAVREKILLNSDWYFFKYDSTQQADALIYDVRPPLSDTRDDIPADAQPTEALQVEADVPVLKPWILPSGNAFIKNPAQHHQRPEGQPGSDFPFVQGDFTNLAGAPSCPWCTCCPTGTGRAERDNRLLCMFSPRATKWNSS